MCHLVLVVVLWVVSMSEGLWAISYKHRRRRQQNIFKSDVEYADKSNFSPRESEDCEFAKMSKGSKTESHAKSVKSSKGSIVKKPPYYPSTYPPRPSRKPISPPSQSLTIRPHISESSSVATSPTIAARDPAVSASPSIPIPLEHIMPLNPSNSLAPDSAALPSERPTLVELDYNLTTISRSTHPSTSSHKGISPGVDPTRSLAPSSPPRRLPSTSLHPTWRHSSPTPTKSVRLNPSPRSVSSVPFNVTYNTTNPSVPTTSNYQQAETVTVVHLMFCIDHYYNQTPGADLAGLTYMPIAVATNPPSIKYQISGEFQAYSSYAPVSGSLNLVIHACIVGINSRKLLQELNSLPKDNPFSSTISLNCVTETSPEESGEIAGGTARKRTLLALAIAGIAVVAILFTAATTSTAFSKGSPNRIHLTFRHYGFKRRKQDKSKNSFFRNDSIAKKENVQDPVPYDTNRNAGMQQIFLLDFASVTPKQNQSSRRESLNLPSVRSKSLAAMYIGLGCDAVENGSFSWTPRRYKNELEAQDKAEWSSDSSHLSYCDAS